LIDVLRRLSSLFVIVIVMDCKGNDA
jgi:hypothetical protein